MHKEIEQNPPAKIKIVRPENCDRTALSINALDKHTRDLAWTTFVYVDESGDIFPLLCESFKVNDKGNLILEIKAECFEFTEVV